ncbi:MAG: metalloregulator ArsR/SmtB family transcription factor [Bryobacteraceae bacterium]
MDQLRIGDRPAGEIANGFSVSRPAISKHLRILRRASLVSERQAGRNRVYRLNPDRLREMDGWLEKYRNFWNDSPANLKSHAASGGQK